MMQGMGRFARSGRWALAMLVMTFVIAGCAQTPSPESQRAQQRALFEQMIREPANVDVALQYAALSRDLGDYEAAITALERMHLFAPDLPRVHAELGILYYRLGAFDIARDYFNRAISAPNVPDDVRERVAPFLSEIADSTARPESDNDRLALVGAGVRF